MRFASPHLLKVFNDHVRWPAYVVWSLAWALMWALRDVLNLGNLGLLLVLASSLTSVWLSTSAALGYGAFSVLAFNWLFVAPRFTLNVEFKQDLLLLITLLCVCSSISYLMSALRRSANQQLRLAGEAAHVEQFLRVTRDAATPLELALALQAMLHTTTGLPVSVLVLKDSLPKANDESRIWLIGLPGSKQLEALWASLREVVAIGPGTGRYTKLDSIYLPLRGRSACFGAIALHQQASLGSAHSLAHLQQLANLLGREIERSHAIERAKRANERAQEQAMRNTFLASISHDFRTPLATLIGAASSIRDQGTVLSADQIGKLADAVVCEAEQLNRMTANTLELARLGSDGFVVKRDWESVEDICGAVVTRVKAAYPNITISVALAEPMPLLWCDAILISQLLDNLIENAIRYGPKEREVWINASANYASIQISVIDQGPGIPDHWKKRVFEPFEQMYRDRRGTGLGLAISREIARLHDAAIEIEDAVPLGTIVKIAFANRPQPALPTNFEEPLD